MIPLWKRFCAFILSLWMTISPVVDAGYLSLQSAALLARFVPYSVKLLRFSPVVPVAAVSFYAAKPQVARADAFSDSVDAGKTLGSEQLGPTGVANVPALAGSDVIMPSAANGDGTFSSAPVSTKSNFSGSLDPGLGGVDDPDAGSEVDQARSAYGNNGSFVGIVGGITVPRLGAGLSTQAVGFQAITEGQSQLKPTLARDPTLTTLAEDAFTNGVSSIAAGCQVTTTSTTTVESTTLRETRHCRRAKINPTCDMRRDLQSVPGFGGDFQIFRLVATISDINAFGYDGVANGDINATCSGQSNGAGINGCGGTGFFSAGLDNRILGATVVVTPLNISRIWDWQNQGASDPTLIWTLDTTYVVDASGNMPLQNHKLPNADNGWKGYFLADQFNNGGDDRYDGLIYTATVHVRALRQTFYDSPAGCRNGYFQTMENVVMPACPTCSGNSAALASNYYFQCLDAAASRTIGGIVVSSTLWGEKLGPLIPKAPATPPAPICYQAKVNYSSGMQVQLECYPNVATGEMICPVATLTDEEDTCGPLRTDPSCTFVSETPVTGAVDGAGNPTAWYQKWDCEGETIEAAVGSTNDQSYVCSGEIRCMGQECTENPNENNAGFGKTTGYFNIAQQAGIDGSCKEQPNSDCKIFNGKPMPCKVAMWGISDCCEAPQPPMSWVDYLKFGMLSYKAANMSGALEWLAAQGFDMPGTWTSVSNWAGSNWDSLMQWGSNLISPVDSMVACTPPAGFSFSTIASNPTYPGEATAGMMQQAENAIGDWAFETFGEDVAGEIFQQQFLESEGVMEYSFGGAGTMLGTLMMAYMYVQLFIMIVQLIYSCEDSEFEGQMKKELRVCHYVGDFCGDELFGACIEQNSQYCCYNTLFARLIAQQARAVHPDRWSWGTPEDPNCDGFTPAELGTMDWEQFDLSEWIASLSIAGLAPAGDANLDDFYSRNNVTMHKNPGAPDALHPMGTGPTTTELLSETLQRGTPDDMEESRMAVREELLNN